ncbi:unnamed protein product [Lathyrus sativus]|nr:unnamed protein product [Lathyrus sativus]
MKQLFFSTIWPFPMALHCLKTKIILWFVKLGSEFRCIKHWLKGNNKGKTDIFIENLSGGPDNINLAPDGSFWIALLQMTSERRGFVHTSKVFKHLLASFPRLINLFNSAIKSAMVVKVDTEGNIIKEFGDNDGKIITGVTSAVEFEDHLYLGSLNTDFVGKFQLPIVEN